MFRENNSSDEEEFITHDMEDEGNKVAASDSQVVDVNEITQAENDIDPDMTGSKAQNVPKSSQSPVSFTSPPPLDKFRGVARRVMRMQRASSFMVNIGAGNEPGIDPRRESASVSYGHIKADCLIDVIDYSGLKCVPRTMTNDEFVGFMNDSSSCKKAPWVKVRWINIGGLSWDVISALAIKYDLHPLAVEDVLNPRGNVGRSKADYFPKHLFLKIVCHSLGKAEQEHFTPLGHLDGQVTVLPRSESPSPIDGTKEGPVEKINERPKKFASAVLETVGAPAPPSALGRSSRKKNKAAQNGWPGVRWGKMPVPSDPARIAARRRRIDQMSINELKRGERLEVNVRPMYIFLTREGTVISIYPANDLEFTEPIAARLSQADSGLRKSTDPSLLVQALLDLIVDQAMALVEEYHSRLLKLEQDVLLRPKIKTVRLLHILSGDLMMQRRTLAPVRSVIYGLRRYDQDRCAALYPGKNPAEVPGYMSHKSKIYLADVVDHIEYVMSSMDMFEFLTENMITYTFNLKSYDMGQVMRRLTLATIVFLPLTLLTGYFGMNFTYQWTIRPPGHTDVIYWIIALPLVAIVVAAFMQSDIRAAWSYVEKRVNLQKVANTHYRRLGML